MPAKASSKAQQQKIDQQPSGSAVSAPLQPKWGDLPDQLQGFGQLQGYDRQADLISKGSGPARGSSASKGSTPAKGPDQQGVQASKGFKGFRPARGPSQQRVWLARRPGQQGVLANKGSRPAGVKASKGPVLPVLPSLYYCFLLCEKCSIICSIPLCSIIFQCGLPDDNPGHRPDHSADHIPDDHAGHRDPKGCVPMWPT